MNAQANIFRFTQELRFNSVALLNSYAALLFSHSRWTGLLLLLATFLEPRLGLAALLGAMTANLLARFLKFSDDGIRHGLYGYNAILVSLGLMTLTHGSSLNNQAWLITLGAALMTVPLSAALNAIAQRTWSLPILATPFLLVFGLAYGLTDHSPLDLARVAATDLSFGATLALVFKSFGSLLFIPRLEVGILVLIALFLHSRMATTAAVVGLLVGIMMRDYALGNGIAGVYYAPLPLNAMLSALAVSAIFFIPGRMTLLWGIGAALMSCMITIALHGWLGNTFPPLIIPFVLSTWIMLLMARQRVKDDSPRSTYFMSRSPESNYRFHHTGGGSSTHGEPEITLPFRGSWICTQAIDGAFTHQGPWRYAFDFEVVDTEQSLYKNHGEMVDDFLCYDLPVLAVAEGIVVRVINSIPDNPVGEANLKDNWGNTVIIKHQHGLYSALSHLKEGSIQVSIGQEVSRGQQLGLCGNSGRSPRPHLHFQMQATDELGAETILRPFSRCLLEEDTPRFAIQHIPVLGEIISATAFSRSIEAMLPQPLFSPAQQWLVQPDEHRQFPCKLAYEVDVEGRPVMSIHSHKARLYISSDYARFACHDRAGKDHTLLRLHALAIPQLAKIDATSYTWEQRIPLAELFPEILQAALELITPWIGAHGLKMQYEVTQRNGRLIMTGHSHLKISGKALVQTQCHLDAKSGIHYLQASILDRQLQACLASHTHLLSSEGVVPCPVS